MTDVASDQVRVKGQWRWPHHKDCTETRNQVHCFPDPNQLPMLPRHHSLLQKGNGLMTLQIQKALSQFHAMIQLAGQNHAKTTFTGDVFSMQTTVKVNQL